MVPIPATPSLGAEKMSSRRSRVCGRRDESNGSKAHHLELNMIDSTFLDPFCTSGNSPTPGIDPPVTPGVLRTTTGNTRLIGPAGAPVTLVLGGIAATSKLHWWSHIVGHGLAIDTTRSRVLSLDWTIEPGATTHDQARALITVLDALHIHRLERAIGCSYGGMVLLAAAEIAPRRFDELVLLGAAHRCNPQAAAWRWIQREATSLGGNGALAEAIESHVVAPEKITVPTHVIGFDSDLLVPGWLLDELAARLPNPRRTTIASECGHDGYLLETAAVSKALRSGRGRRCTPSPERRVPPQTSRPTFGVSDCVVPFPRRAAG